MLISFLIRQRKKRYGFSGWRGREELGGAERKNHHQNILHEKKLFSV